MKSWHWGVGLVGVCVAAAGLVLALHKPEVDCARQAPQNYTPQCIAEAGKQAQAGSTDAMLRLAQHYESGDRAAAASWTRQAAQAGAPAAIRRIFEHCGVGQPFSVADAEALLPRASELDQAYFHLGGSCKAADPAWAAKWAPASLQATQDTAAFCRIAVKYGQLSILPAGAKLDAAAAAQLLAECEKRAGAGSEPAKQAQSVRQMMERQIRAVRLE